MAVKEEKVVVMPEKVEIDGKMVYSKDSIFTKEQFSKMLLDAGVDVRASVGQGTLFYKGTTPDTKVLERTGTEIISKYIQSRSKVREQVLSQFEGISEEDIKTNIKSQKLENWISTIQLALITDVELEAQLLTGEGAGKPMLERVAQAQKTKVSKMCFVKKEEVTEEQLTMHLKTMTSKYGVPALFGTKYRNISPQELISMIRDRAKK